MEVEHGGLRFERLGHASVRIETGDGIVVYIDPWSEVLEGVPRDGDVVFTSHDDFDHYDTDAIEAVAKADATAVAYEEIDTSGLDREVVSLAEGGEVTVEGIAARGVPAYNRSDGSHLRPNGEPYHPRGTVIGLVLTIDDTTIYFTSDTDALEANTGIEADVVIPPIGGRPTMDRHEAATFVEAIGPDLVLPVHYNSDRIDGIDTDEQAFKENVESKGIRVELF